MYTAPLLAFLIRWRPPFGAFTLITGVPAVLVGIVDPLLLGGSVMLSSLIGFGVALLVTLPRSEAADRLARAV